MCLRVTDDWLKSKTTEKDVVCYKVGLEKNGVIIAPFYEEEYIFGETVCCNFFEKEIPEQAIFPDEVYYGYHSFVGKEEAFKMRKILSVECYGSSKYVVMECVIPAETAYYEGGVCIGGEDIFLKIEKLPKGYVSERIRIEKIIER